MRYKVEGIGNVTIAEIEYLLAKSKYDTISYCYEVETFSKRFKKEPFHLSPIF